MKIRAEHTIQYAHRLLMSKGPCRNLHGHTGRIVVSVEGEPRADGMIFDFALFEHLWERIDRSLDHAIICSPHDEFLLKNGGELGRVCQVAGEPTAEVIAESTVLVVQEWLKDYCPHIDLSSVEVEFYEGGANAVVAHAPSFRIERKDP